MMWFALALMVSAQIAMTSSAQAQVLTGDARLACEALVCLSAGGKPPRGVQQGVGQVRSDESPAVVQSAGRVQLPERVSEEIVHSEHGKRN